MAPRAYAGESDSDLLARMARADEAALAELYDRHGGTVYAIALAILNDAADAEEAAADAFLQAWRGAATFDATRATAIAWLTVIARSRALDRLRARRRRSRALENAAAGSTEGTALPVAEPAPADEAADLRDTRERVSGFLAELPDPQRRCIELAYLDGLTHTEIAERLGEPLGTVKTRIRAGMDKLRNALAAYVKAG